ncbi:DUF4396 domain-containing protein [Roseospira navarrensis]|uniref:DUF4396 domain-containing protein n=1 Tax=Roseospira navarrensis TaxID=140058 RepID=A0A7X2D312_9PROT|nr:DUF4396 domain-containing protein [Roseospira navarrensis]MQX36306.1 DUF4396 domain-containing protein [Roseospira navarrensis]
MDAIRSALVPVLNHPATLSVWVALNALCVVWLLYDLRTRNPQTHGLMRWVWILTVSYSGPIGLAVYYWSGRAQIARDSLSRRAFRSVSHCYAGCGIGEIAGVIIAAGILALGTLAVGAVSFALAYVAGFALTIGPLMAAGETFPVALKDTLVSETISITVMEVVAISVDIWLAGGAGMSEPLFWTGLLVSLSAGLLAAWPANVLLIHFGIKEGMGHPGEAHAH